MREHLRLCGLPHSKLVAPACMSHAHEIQEDVADFYGDDVPMMELKSEAPNHQKGAVRRKELK